MEAKKAFANDEIPVGAIIVRDGRVVAKSCNENRAMKNPILHAEILAIVDASKKLNNERLTDCEIFVTKEPCAMCAGAIIHARIKRVVIATEDIKYGACGSVLTICGNKNLNHIPVIEFGLLRDEAATLLKKFFQKKRI